MTAYIEQTVRVYDAGADNHIQSGPHATWSTVRAGTGLAIGTESATSMTVGNYYIAPNYGAYEAFLDFDMTAAGIPVDAVWQVGYIHIFTNTNPSAVSDLQLRWRDWGTAVATGDWVAGADIAASCPLITYTTVAIIQATGGQPIMGIGTSAGLDWDMQGPNRILLCGSLLVSGTPTTADYWTLYSSEHGSKAPYVDVTYRVPAAAGSSGSAGRGLVARPFGTRASAAESLARTQSAPLDWHINASNVLTQGMRPATPARQKWLVANRGTPGVAFEGVYEAEETPDYVCVIYRSVGSATVPEGFLARVYRPSLPSSAIARLQTINLSGQYMTQSDAEAYGDGVLARASSDVLSAKLTVKGGLYTVDGAFVPAPVISAGDWIDITDMREHAPVYITGCTYDGNTHTATITTGGREQDELVVPGVSALPTRPQVYSATTPEVYVDESASGEDKKGSYDPGGVDPGVGHEEPPPGWKSIFW